VRVHGHALPATDLAGDTGAATFHGLPFYHRTPP
jgi:hypothetical protein